MAKVEEIKKKLTSTINFLEAYRGYGDLVVESIEDLKKIEELLKEPTKENAAQCLEIIQKLESRIGPYASYVPDIIINLSIMKDELKKI